MAIKVPFLDLVTPHKELETELVSAFREALNSAGFIGGAAVDTFEKSFASYCQAKYCVGVSSGTDALRFALMAAEIGPGHAVVTVPNTFIATSEAISQTGARPYFADVDERTYNMDPAKLREFLQVKCSRNAVGEVMTEHGQIVRAIVPVHLYGQMADMDAIMDIADEFGLLVIEDACQAHGAEYFSKRNNAWLRAGSIGFAAAFSFYPGKNLGACGEAGAVTTNSEEAARQMRMIRDHGQAKKYFHDVEGYNGRLDAIQATFLSIKLKHLEEWNQARRELARRYNEEFESSVANIVRPFEPNWSRAVYHLYVVQVEDREGVQQNLAAVGIGTAIHYPVPLHLQKAYSDLGYTAGDFPVAERLAPRILSLPMFPQMSAEQQQYVAEKVGALVARHAAAFA